MSIYKGSHDITYNSISTSILPIGSKISASNYVVNDDNEIMLITNQGIVIRLLCKDISTTGRITTGVKLINMDIENDITVASIAKVRQKSADESESLSALEQEMEEAENDESAPEEEFEEDDIIEESNESEE